MTDEENKDLKELKGRIHIGYAELKDFEGAYDAATKHYEDAKKIQKWNMKENFFYKLADAYFLSGEKRDISEEAFKNAKAKYEEAETAKAKYKAAYNAKAKYEEAETASKNAKAKYEEAKTASEIKEKYKEAKKAFKDAKAKYEEAETASKEAAVAETASEIKAKYEEAETASKEAKEKYKEASEIEIVEKYKDQIRAKYKAAETASKEAKEKYKEASENAKVKSYEEAETASKEAKEKYENPLETFKKAKENYEKAEEAEKIYQDTPLGYEIVQIYYQLAVTYLRLTTISTTMKTALLDANANSMFQPLDAPDENTIRSYIEKCKDYIVKSETIVTEHIKPTDADEKNYSEKFLFKQQVLKHFEEKIKTLRTKSSCPKES